MFSCQSAELNVDLQASTADGGDHVHVPEASYAEQGQGEADLVAPTMEEPTVVEPTTPIMEEPPVTGLTSPSGGLHDEGDSGGKDLWSAVATSVDPARVGARVIRNALSSPTQEPSTVAKQAMASTMSTVMVGLGQPVQTQHRLRKAPLQVAAVEVEEIPWEPAPPL